MFTMSFFRRRLEIGNTDSPDVQLIQNTLLHSETMNKAHHKTFILVKKDK